MSQSYAPTARPLFAAAAILAASAGAAGQFQSGACCYPSGQCIVTLAGFCTLQGGVYHGNNTTCSSSCPVGACCLPDNTCTVTSSLICTVRNGVFHGIGVPCHATLCGPTTLFGVDFSGNLVRINKATGQSTLVGFGSGFPGQNGGAVNSRGAIFTHTSDSNQLLRMDPYTGLGTVHVTLTGRPTGYGIRAMAFDQHDQLYLVFSQASTGTEDLLATADVNTGEVTVVGGMGQANIQGLDVRSDGAAYASGVDGTLYTVILINGLTTPVASPNVGAEGQSLQFDRDGSLYAARTNLRRVSVAGGLSFLVGPTGRDLRGLAAISGYCYANCDHSGTPPLLNVNDFVCFQNQFAAGNPYANCDGSTTAPVLNVNDFICFQSQFAAGCQ